MAILQQTANGDVLASARLILPPGSLGSGLIGWWYPGGSEEQTLRNLAYAAFGDTQENSLVGSPTINPASISVSAANYMQTDVGDIQAGITIGLAAKLTTTVTGGSTGVALISCYGTDAAQGNASVGCGITCFLAGTSSGTKLQGFATFNNISAPTGVQPTADDQDLNSAYFLALLTVDGTTSPGPVKILNATSGASQFVNGTLPRLAQQTRKFSIGLRPSSPTLTGHADIAWCGIWNRLMTDPDEISSLQTVVRAAMAARGLTLP